MQNSQHCWHRFDLILICKYIYIYLVALLLENGEFRPGSCHLQVPQEPGVCQDWHKDSVQVERVDGVSHLPTRNFIKLEGVIQLSADQLL